MIQEKIFDLKERPLNHWDRQKGYYGQKLTQMSFPIALLNESHKDFQLFYMNVNTIITYAWVWAWLCTREND